MEDNLIKRRR